MMRHEGGITLRRSAALQSSGRTESRCLGGSRVQQGAAAQREQAGSSRCPCSKGKAPEEGDSPLDHHSVG